MQGALVGKVGNVFTSSATQPGGQKSTILSFHTTLQHHGMTIVGLPNSFAGESGQPTIPTDLRPMQKIMQARAGWMKDMNANLVAMNYAKVGNDATALATQIDSIGKTLPNPLAKELTLKISTAATAVADAAGKKDGGTVKMKLAEIKSTCDECHAKIRDNK